MYCIETIHIHKSLYNTYTSLSSCFIGLIYHCSANFVYCCGGLILVHTSDSTTGTRHDAIAILTLFIREISCFIGNFQL